MKTQKLFEILTLVGGVWSYQWDYVMAIVEVIADGTATVEHKEWYDSFKKEHPEFYPLDLSVIRTWSTFEKCVHLSFGVENNKLKCEAIIYDGSNFGGYRTGKRFEAVIILPESFIFVIERSIENKFDTYLENAYNKHLEQQKNKWISKLRKQIITN